MSLGERIIEWVDPKRPCRRQACADPVAYRVTTIHERLGRPAEYACFFCRPHAMQWAGARKVELPDQ